MSFSFEACSDTFVLRSIRTSNTGMSRMIMSTHPRTFRKLYSVKDFICSSSIPNKSIHFSLIFLLIASKYLASSLVGHRLSIPAHYSFPSSWFYLNISALHMYLLFHSVSYLLTSDRLLLMIVTASCSVFLAVLVITRLRCFYQNQQPPCGSLTTRVGVPWVMSLWVPYISKCLLNPFFSCYLLTYRFKGSVPSGFPRFSACLLTAFAEQTTSIFNSYCPVYTVSATKNHS